MVSNADRTLIEHLSREMDGEESIMNDHRSRQYDSEAVNRIIKRSLQHEQSDAISYDELLETARELGIDSRKVEAAIVEEAAGREGEDAKNEWLRRKRSKFHAHLWSYLIVNGALFLINIMTPGPWWFQWPVLGWGIGLAFDLRQAYFPTEDQMEKGTRRTLRRRKRRGR